MDRRLVRDIRVLISAPRRIELAGAVDAEQAVVAGLVQVNDPRCPLDVGPRLIRLLVAIPRPHRIIILLAILFLMGAQRRNQLFRLFLDHPVYIDQLFVGVIDHRLVRLSPKEHRTAPDKRLIIGRTFRDQRIDAVQQLPFAAYPFEDGHDERIFS